MGKKSAENLVKAIADSKTRGLDRVLYGLGIRLIGSKAAGTIANVVKSMERFMTITKEELVAVEESVLLWLIVLLNTVKILLM